MCKMRSNSKQGGMRMQEENKGKWNYKSESIKKRKVFKEILEDKREGKFGMAVIAACLGTLAVGLGKIEYALMIFLIAIMWLNESNEADNIIEVIELEED